MEKNSRDKFLRIFEQALRDFCSKSDKIVKDVAEWVISDDFSVICFGAEIKPEEARSVFVYLANIEDRTVRRDEVEKQISVMRLEIDRQPQNPCQEIS